MSDTYVWFGDAIDHVPTIIFKIKFRWPLFVNKFTEQNLEMNTENVLS